MQVSQMFPFSLLAVCGEPHPKGFEMRGDEEQGGCKREKRQSTVYIKERIWYWEKIFCMAAPHELCSALWLQDFGISDEDLELS